MNAYSVLDKQSKQFGAPYFQHNHVTAVRLFKMEINRPDPNNVLYHNPSDFTLYHVGTWNQENGHLSGSEILPIMTGEDARKENIK